MKFATCCGIVISYTESATTVAGTQESKKQHTAEHPDISDTLFYSAEIPECHCTPPSRNYILMVYWNTCVYPISPSCTDSAKRRKIRDTQTKFEEIGYIYTNLTVGGVEDTPNWYTTSPKGLPKDTKRNRNSWCIMHYFVGPASVRSQSPWRSAQPQPATHQTTHLLGNISGCLGPWEFL